MSGLIKGVKKVFKKVANVVKKIIKPVAIAVAAYFTVGLALSYIPATQAFAAGLPGFASAAGPSTGIFSKVASKIGLSGGLEAGALKAAGTAVTGTAGGGAVAELGGMAGKTTLGGAVTGSGASAPAAAAGMSLTDKLLLAKIGTDVGGALFGPTPQEIAEAEAIEAAKFRGSYYGMEAGGAAPVPEQAQPQPQAQAGPMSPEQQQLQAGRTAREELFPQAKPQAAPGMSSGPGAMQQQLTPPPGLFAPAENVRYV